MDSRIFNLIKSIRIEQEKEQILQMKLASLIINSSDPEELKNKIVREIAVALNATRCFFLEFDSSKNNFKKITNAYTTQRALPNILGFDVEANLTTLAMRQKYLKSLLVDDTEKFIKQNNLVGSREEEYFKNFGVKSYVTVRLEFGEVFLGILVVHYDYKKLFLQKDLKFLKNIAEHISIALHLSTLYSEERKKKEREKLLRSLISIMSEDYDLPKVTKKIFEILGNIFKANKIFIDIDVENIQTFHCYKLPEYGVENKEECDRNQLNSFYKMPDFENIKNKVNYLPDVKNFILQNNLESNLINEYFIDNNIKSLLILPILQEFSQYGFLLMQFDKVNPLFKDDVFFIKTVVEQLAIAIKQAQSYEKEKKTAQKESLLRSITETMRSSLDLDEMLSFTCREILNIFNVQRVTVNLYNVSKNPSGLVIKKEYKINPEIKGFELNEEILKPVQEYWMQKLLKDRVTLAFDDLENSDAPEYFKNIYLEIGVKSIVGVALKKGKNAWGTLVLSDYSGVRHWTEEEKVLLDIIASQILISITQVELYESTKKYAEREGLLRKIFSTMRTSLDVNLIKKTIVTEIGKALGCDFCFIAIYDKDNDFFSIDENSEYRSENEENTFVGFDTNSDWVNWFKESFKRKQEVSYPDVEKFLADNNLRGTKEEEFLKTYNIKSSYSVPIYYANNYGYIILHYTKNCRKLDRSELDFIKLIADQSGIALHQANLYEKLQLQAEREKINRSILEILRSSLDKSTIKHLFVNNIGKLFNADRVFFADYDSKKKMFVPLEESSEYLSSPSEKSFVGYDWSGSANKEYIQPLLDKRELKISCWDDYIKENPKSSGFISLFEEAQVKSSYNFPVLFEGKILGFFCIEFTQGNCRFLSSEDIVRIRSMCSQAGIALYHSDLYVKAQESAYNKEKIIDKLFLEIQEPVKSIIEQVEMLKQGGCTQPEHLKSIAEVSKSAKQLLDIRHEL